jgi:thioredoxin 1
MNLTDLTFEEETKLGISIIDFWAPWCSPCRTIAPLIDELEKKYKEEGIKVLKSNVDECPELSTKFSIRSIPTIVVLRDGKEIARQTGTGPVAQKIEEMVLKAKES